MRHLRSKCRGNEAFKPDPLLVDVRLYLMYGFLHEEGQPKEQMFGGFRHWRNGKIVQIMPSSCLEFFPQLAFKNTRGIPFVPNSRIVDRSLRSSHDNPSRI